MPLGLIFLVPLIMPNEKSDLSIFPSSNHYPIKPFTDSEDSSGNSTCFISNDTSGSLIVNYTLRMHSITKRDPYAGFYFTLTERDSFVDVSSYDSIRIQLTARRTKSFKIQLKTFIDNFTIYNDYKTYRIENCEVIVRPDSTVYSRSLDNDFKLAPCTYQLPIIAGLPARPKYSKLFSIDIQTGSCAINSDSAGGNFIVKQITFVKRSHKKRVASICFCCLFLYYVAILLIITFRLPGKKTISRAKPGFNEETCTNPQGCSNDSSENPATPHLASTDSVLQDRNKEYINKITNCIKEHFADDTLTTDKVSQITGLKIHKISSLIELEYNKKFHQYLHEIRISEAKKLLIETKYSIQSVALKTGYSSTNQFDRVFHEMERMSPKAFRENHMKNIDEATD